ncbi:MAG: chromosome segregation protein SMC [Acidimicrobiia bacterium]
MKTLKVAGFKSFADRTRLEFRPGVSVVVGPNGSGKSNLVDAIHWVLGTQAPRSLRTARMDDVIFAGTATRPALNRSEVTVIFDNNRRQMALDLDEVAITRRLYRDGSSEYEINGMACRLLDVTELLSDSGVGRHQHIIINQGQVDAILGAGPEEHRAVIEEAAGILKHKLRKERAMRRLERTDEDLVRLTDILAEVSRQMRPLKRQAEAADRHGALVSEVRSLALFLAGEELRQLDGTLQDARTSQTELSTALAAARSLSARLESEIDSNARAASDRQEALDRDSEAAARLETTTERLRRVAQVAQERHRNARSRRQGADERRNDLEEEQLLLQREIVETEALCQHSSNQSGQDEASFRLLEEQERSLADQADLSAEGALAVVQGERRSFVAADERDRRELAQIEHRLTVVGEQIEAENKTVTDVDQEMLDLDALVGKAQDRYETSAATRRREQEAWETAQLEEQDRRLDAVAALARRDAIAASEAGPADVQRIVANGQGALGSLTSLWNVSPEWLPAVNAALGPWADAIAFEGATDLEDAIASAKAIGGGGQSAVRGRPGGLLSAPKAPEHGIAPLIDLIGATGSEIAVALMGDVVVVDGWIAAWAFAKDQPELRVVTPEGDLFTVDGIRLAPTAKLLLEAANVELDRAEVGLAKATSRMTSMRRQFEANRAAEREALEALESLEARLAGITEARGRTKRMVVELAGEHLRLEQRQGLLDNVIAERQLAIERLGPTISALEGEEAERQRLMADVSERRWQLASAKEDARVAWQEAERTLSASSERLLLLRGREQTVEEELAARGGGSVSDDDLARLQNVEFLAVRAIEVIRHKIGVLRERQAVGREQLRIADLKLSRQRSELSRAKNEIESHRETLSTLAIVEAEARVRREAVAEGLRRDLDTDEDAALEANAIAGDNLSELLVQRQAELRRMGAVNPLAAEEYRELADRHDFMAGQLEDLEKSRSDLRQVMRALDEEIQARFSSAFEEVAAAYQDYFGVLFPGGAGRMRLTDPGQPLTSGVEIEAQPMGKKIGDLSLLSGGERSLAALAFLFGVFRARPSPFYILDEVEAALDDSNLRRFLRLVDTFRGESQLVLITHQQQTMEVADVLYGVTMEPGGSSQVLSRDLATLNI